MTRPRRDGFVPDHLIRFRRGWQLLTDDAPGSPYGRVSLPALWPAGPARKLRLFRRFGQPRAALPGETLWLRLDRVPGLGPITLNGSLLRERSEDGGLIEILLPELADRNELIVEVRLPEGEPTGVDHLAEWGDIALVVRRSPG